MHSLARLAACRSDRRVPPAQSIAVKKGGRALSVTMRCSGGDAYGGGRRREMSLREYAEWWRQHKAGASGRLLYLKDWHFASEFPEYQVCRPPRPDQTRDASACIHAASLIVHQAEHRRAE